MPKLTVDGKTQEFAEDKRLVLAIKEMGVNIGHRCGGQARCTTCRVDISAGEPDTMTQAEYDKLKDADLLGQVRLSCQLLCSQDMSVSALMTQESEGWPDSGTQPAPEVEPVATWLTKAELSS